MRRLKLFVVLTFLQGALLHFSPIAIQAALAADAAEGRQSQQFEESDETSQTAQGGLETSHEVHETSHEAPAGERGGIPTESAASSGITFKVPALEAIQYPYPASVEQLDKDASYMKDGTVYKYYGQQNGIYVFDSIKDGSRSTHGSVESFVVTDDPAAQVEKDMQVVQNVKKEGRRLWEVASVYLSQCDAAVARFRQAVLSARKQETEETFRIELKKAEEELTRLQTTSAILRDYQGVIETGLRQGLALCQSIRERAGKLTKGFVLLKKLSALQQGLHDDVTAVTSEQASYAAAREEAEQSAASLRGFLKLMSDLREVQGHFTADMEKLTVKNGQIEAVVKEAEGLCERIVTTDVSERELLAKHLQEAHARHSEEIEKLMAESSALRKEMQMLMPLKARCDAYTHEEVPAFSAAMKQFRTHTDEVEKLLKDFDRLVQRAAGAVQTLKVYAESHAVLDSDVLRQGLEKVKERIQASDEAYGVTSGLPYRVAEQALNLAVRRLMDAVKSGNLLAIPLQLLSVQRQVQAFKDAAAAAEEELDSQLKALLELHAELHRLGAFANRVEEKKQLQAAVEEVQTRINRASTRRESIRRSTVLQRHNEALEKAVLLPLETAEFSLSEAKAKEVIIRAKMDESMADPGVVSEVKDMCAEVTKRMQDASEAHGALLKCLDIEGVREVASKTPPVGGLSLFEKLEQRSSDFRKKAQTVAHSLDGMTAALETKKEVVLVSQELQAVINAAKPHVETLKQVPTEGGPPEQAGSWKMVEQSMSALQSSLGTPDFDPAANNLIEDVLKAALMTTALHAESALAEEKTASQAEGLAIEVEQVEDPTREREDISPETLKASRLMQRHAFAAAAALAVYDKFAEMKGISGIVQTVPFAAGGIDENSLAAAAAVLKTKTRAVEERVTTIFKCIDKYQAYVRRFLQTHLKEMLQALEAAMRNLDLKAEAARSVEHKAHVLHQRREYKTAHNALSACMSLSTLQLKDARSCFSSSLRLVVSSAATALERAKNLQQRADYILAEAGDMSSPAAAASLEEVSTACTIAMDFLDLSLEGLRVYEGSTTSPFIHNVAASAPGSGAGTSLKGDTETLRGEIQSTTERLNTLRETVHQRNKATVQTSETRIAEVLGVVQRATEKVRTIAPADLSSQKLFLDGSAELEKMLASAKFTQEIPTLSSSFEATVQSMFRELLDQAEGRLKQVESEKAHTEACVRGTESCLPTFTEQEEMELQATCEKLLQLLRLINATLETCQELEGIDGLSGLLNGERRQELVVASAALEAQLRPLCETVKEQFHAAREEAKSRLALLKTVLGETLHTRAIAALSKVSDPVRVNERLKHHLESCDILQSNASSPTFSAGVREREAAVMKLLVSMGADLQNKCQQYLAEASAVVEAPFPHVQLTVESVKVENDVLPKVSRCKQLVDAARALFAAYESLPQEGGSSGADASERAMYADCTAQAQQLGAALSELPQRLADKLNAMKQHAMQVVDKVVAAGKEAAAKLDAEEAGGTSPTSACSNGRTRTGEIKNRLQQGLSELESSVRRWGTVAYTARVRAATVDILASLLLRAQMHQEAGNAKLPNMQKCSGEGAVCADPELAASVEQALSQGVREKSNIVAHAAAAKDWVKQYAVCIAEGDVSDVARHAEIQPGGLSLPEQEAKLLSEIRSLEEAAKQYPTEVQQRAATLGHVAGDRLQTVKEVLEKGINTVSEQVENTGEESLVAEALALKEKLETERRSTRDLALRRQTAASPIRTEEHVADILRMLVSHASNLVDRCQRKEQEITECLQHPVACQISQPGEDRGIGPIVHVDSIVALSRVASLALEILADFLTNNFIEAIAKKTHMERLDPSSALILEHAADLWKKTAEIQKRVPSLATRVRAQRWKSSYQSQLAKLVSVIYENLKNLRDDDTTVQQSAQEKSEQAADLLETVQGVQGAVVPFRVEAGVTKLVKMVVVEATKFISLAKESLETAESAIGMDPTVITTSFSTNVKAAAEAAISAGHQRALSATLLLAFIDPTTDPSGEILDVLKHIPGAEIVTTAEQLYAQTEELKSRAHVLRSSLRKREESGGALAAQSLDSLTQAIRSCSAKLELDASTRKSHTIATPVKDRLSSMLGLLQTLRLRWNFPASLAEYLPLLHGCAHELLKSAQAAVSTAESMCESATELTSHAGPRLGITGSFSEDSRANALYCQGRDYVRLGSALLECLLDALAAGEVEQTEPQRTVLLVESVESREAVSKETAALQAQIEKVLKQLSRGEMELLSRTHRDLLTEVCKDRLNHMVASVEMSLKRLSGRLEEMQGNDQASQAAISASVELHKKLGEELTAFREKCSTAVSLEDVHQAIMAALSSCLQAAQQNMNEAEVATTEASVCLMQGGALAAAEGEGIESQAKSAIQRAENHLFLACVGMDTLQSCTRLASIGELARTNSSTPDGVSIAEDIEELVTRNVALTPRVDGVKDDLRRRQATPEEHVTRQPEKEVVPSRIQELKMSSAGVRDLGAGATSQEAAQSDVAREVKHQLDEIERYLQEAEHHRAIYENCVADDTRCDEVFATSDDVMTASTTAASQLLQPVFAAELALKLLQRRAQVERGAEGVVEQGASGDSLPGGEEDHAPLSLTLALERDRILPPFRAWLESLDPRADLVTRFQELLARMLNAQAAARQTNLVVRAVLVLRQVMQILEHLIDDLTDEQSTCRCENKDHVVPSTEEYRMLNSSLILLRSMLCTPGGMQEYVPLLESYMQKLSEDGETSVSVAEQAAEAAKDLLDEAAPDGLNHDTSTDAKVEQEVETASHHVVLSRIFARSLSRVVNTASLLKLTDDLTLYNKAAALTPLKLEADRIIEQAAKVEAMLRELKERLESRRHRRPTDAEISINALILKLGTMTSLLNQSLPKMKSNSVKAVVQSLGNDADALQLSLGVYLQEPNFPVSPSVFATTVTSVGRNLTDYVEGILTEAEVSKANAAACASDTGLRGACRESQEETCNQLLEFVALSHIALDAVETCKDNELLQHILNRPAPDLQGRVSMLERASALRRRAGTLQASIPQLLEVLFDKVHGYARGPTTQKELLTQAINHVLTRVEQIQWRGSVSEEQVDAAREDLRSLLAELVRMGDPEQQQPVHAAAAEAFKVALKLTSELSAAGQRLLGQANKILTGSGGSAILTGNEKAAMQHIKEQVRHIKRLMELARAALYLPNLVDREDCFYDVGQIEMVPSVVGSGDTAGAQNRTVKAETDHLRAKVEHLHAFAGILEDQVAEREERSATACADTLQELLKGLYKGIESASMVQVPDDVDVDKTAAVNLFSKTLEALKDIREYWGYPTFREDLHRTTSASLVPVLKLVASLVERSEQLSTEAESLLDNIVTNADPTSSAADDALGAVTRCDAYAGLAQAGLDIVFTCSADSSMREALVTTPVKVAGDSNRGGSISATEFSDKLFKRLTGVKETIHDIREQLSGAIVDNAGTAETMVAALRASIARLSGPEIHAQSIAVGQRRAALEERLQTLQNAAQNTTGDAVEAAITREVAAATEDVIQCLSETAYQENAAVARNKLDESLKDLTVAVDALTTQAEELVTKCGGVAEALKPEELLAFFESAEKTVTIDISMFSNVGKNLVSTAQRIELQALYTEVYSATAEEYFNTEGVDEILKKAAREGERVPSAAVMENILKTVAPAHMDALKIRAEEVVGVAGDFKEIATREEGKVKHALAQVIPVQLDRLRALISGLLAEETTLSEQIAALARLTSNAVNKHEGKPLTSTADPGALPNEEGTTADQLLREAVKRQRAVMAALKKLMSETDVVVAEVDKILMVVRKIVHPAPKSPFDRQRRLSDANTLDASVPVLEHMKRELFQLKARLLQMEKDISKVTKASTTLTRSMATMKSGGGRTGYLAVGLGLGLPLALLAVGGCAYYQYRRSRKTEISDVATVSSAADSQGIAEAADGIGNVQVSRYDFHEPDSVFVAVEAPADKAVRSLTSLETPEAGVPDTTQRQYMVDEHHIVATRLKEEALKKEQAHERIFF